MLSVRQKEEKNKKQKKKERRKKERWDMRLGKRKKKGEEKLREKDGLWVFGVKNWEDRKISSFSRKRKTDRTHINCSEPRFTSLGAARSKYYLAWLRAMYILRRVKSSDVILHRMAQVM